MKVALVLKLLLSTIVASIAIVSAGHNTAPQQSPWGWQQEWRQSSRGLLQNPMTLSVDRNGRRGRMEDYVPPGYPLERHDVWTPDGWALGVYRIPHGKLRNNKPGPRPVVLLVHGFSLSSLSFALFNPNESIAYILADAGFDVWMLNTRSNDFSRGNLHYSFTDAEYWYISMDELGLIDMPTTVNYVLDKTGAKKLQLLTHSQGGTLAYIMMSAMPHMQDKVASLIAMGPPAFLEFMKAPFLKRWADMRNDRAISLAFYGPSDQIALDDWVLIVNTWPGTTASRDITHWAQMISARRLRLQRYDYGTSCSTLTRYNETCNQQKYGSLEPPAYDLSKIRIPVFIMQGSTDIMVTEEDAAEQQKRIPGSVRINYDRWNHMDFIWWVDVNTLNINGLYCTQ